MEKNAFIAVILSLLVLILYQLWMAYQYPAPPEPAPAPSAKEPVSEAAPAPPRPPAKKVVGGPGAVSPAAAKEVVVETDQYTAVFTTRGARLKSFTLRHYRTAVEKNSSPLEMVAARVLPYPLGVEIAAAPSFNDADLIYAVPHERLRLSGAEEATLAFTARTAGGLVLEKALTFSGSRYPIKVEVAVRGSGQSDAAALLLTSAAENKGGAGEGVFEGVIALVAGKIVRVSGGDLDAGKDFNGEISWAGFGYTYFLSALLPENGAGQAVVVKKVGDGFALGFRGAPDAERGLSRYTLFIGPKDLDVMQGLGRELERSIDFGYFAFVSLPLLYLMRFFHRFTSSYGIDIIVVTVLIKLLLAPLTHKSFVSMKRMQRLQPQMERIKEKFKDDRDKLNKEIWELYRRNKVNPFGGCLPMVLQIPVFIGLYNALSTPIELRHASFLWIKDLSRPDWESLPLALAGWKMGIPVLTLLMGASMFVQQWMTPSAGDPNQRRMMLMMPVVFTVMFVNFPSGLTIYWLVNNVLTIAQQYLINRMDR